jgi:hypothetical protein
MTLSIICFFLFLAAVGLLKYIQYLTKKRVEAETENKSLRASNEAISNRPLTKSDLIDRLRARAANKRND